ncbi:MAG: class I adenylate-forming enzyme family protein [Bacteroidales bacterium]
MIWEHFTTRVVASGCHDAIIAGDRKISYNRLAELATIIGATLPSVTEKPGRVFVRQKEPVAILISTLACWYRGLVPVVLREGMTEFQINEMSVWLKPVAMLDMPIPETNGYQANITPSSSIGSRDEGLVICTSGTTGQPKLVALPAESVIITSEAIKEALALSPADRIAVNTPLGYMYGLIGGCVAGLLAGATCHLFSPRDPLTQLQAAIRSHGITVVQGPPSLFRIFLAYWNRTPFPDVRIITTGGEPLGDDLVRDLDQAFPLAHKLFLYGMTEAGPRISDLSIADGGSIDSCIGVPYSHFEWRLDPIPGSDAGRFILRGPSLFLGYINADGGYDGLDTEGFFHSNDLLSIGEQGRLHFRGRLDRLFRSGGRLVNPEAVERILACHPDVLDAVCHPEIHPLLGLMPVAEVVLEPGKTIDLDSLKKLCRMHVEPHAIPRRIVVAEAWELSESGKRFRPAGPKTPA